MIAPVIQIQDEVGLLSGEAEGSRCQEAVWGAAVSSVTQKLMLHLGLECVVPPCLFVLVFKTGKAPPNSTRRGLPGRSRREVVSQQKGLIGSLCLCVASSLRFSCQHLLTKSASGCHGNVPSPPCPEGQLVFLFFPDP